MTKKIIALLAMMVMLLTGCENSQLNKPSDSTALSEPIVEDMVTSKNPQKYRSIEAFSIIGQMLTCK